MGVWSGLIVGAAALAGVVVLSAAQTPQDGQGRRDGPAAPRTAAAAAEVCEPGQNPGHSAARLAEPGAHDPSALTPAEAAELDQMLRRVPLHQSAPSAQQPQTIPVVVHVISSRTGTGDLGQATIDEQIAVMNKGFSGGYGGADTGFRFELREVTRTRNDTWFSGFPQREDTIKGQLRKGGPETLNLYIVNMDDGVLGRSTFPQNYADAPDRDGVVIDYRTVPGGGREKFDLGYTATHETGHWLGLFHTFQNGCDSPGDYVDDTPYEREQSAGCPEGRDTCSSAGEDPIHNFMNYSDDACLREFTEGQAQRMAQSWAAFRA
ncbi:Pregnancy-associated plasma protein-A [Marinactinospora thermotolerans DSM 45154]|uniref:Pregnancy-associated plasma protein-A n=2 Tax=Marinactinospora thermotolerans TaxID=531310 RepID=A0A1T4Q7X2_9ACTN|nr:Pregnancy-associated plasma protein-A [Marinactinospora thermotolerans DSM 45154]